MAKVSSKWAPSAVVAALIAGGIIAIPMQASAVDLPEKSVEDIISLMDLELEGFSGTVVKTTDLGLPALELSSRMSEDMVAQMEEAMPEGFDEFIPALIEDNSFTEAIAFIAGTDTVRLYASSEGLRAQILDPLSQRDFVINRTEAWSYNARTQTAYTRSFDTEVSQEKWTTAVASLEVDLSNPDAIAQQLLAEVGDDTLITVGEPVRVAGRSAYTLLVSPTDAASLIDVVEVHIDAEFGVGLALTVFSTEQSAPALSVAFESISFDTPDASLFSFTPPPGTTVETLEIPESLEAALLELQARDFSGEELTEAEKEALAREFIDSYGEGIEPVRVGEGWTTVVGSSGLPSAFPRELLESEFFGDLTVSVPGGTVFSTPLVNVLITDSGRVFAGAVTVEYLRSVAAG